MSAAPKQKHRKTIMLKFRSGNFVEEFTSIEESKQRQFGDCIPFTLQQTRRYTNGYLDVEAQLMTPFLDSQSEKSKQSTTNKVYILAHADAKELLKQLGRKRREVKKLKDDDRQKNRREIGKLQRDMLDLERQLFQHFMGILHSLSEEYYLQVMDKSEEMSELRAICEDLQRKADFLELQDPKLPGFPDLKPNEEQDSSTLRSVDTLPRTLPREDGNNSVLKTKIQDLKTEAEDLYDELSEKERTMNKLSNLFQQLAIILPSVPNESFPKTILNKNTNLVTDANAISLGDFDLSDFFSTLLSLSDYIYHLKDTKPIALAASTPAAPIKNRNRILASSSSDSSIENNKSALDAFFSSEPKEEGNKHLVNENRTLKSKIGDLESKLSDLKDKPMAPQKGLFRLQEDLDSYKTENMYLQRKLKDLEQTETETKDVHADLKTTISGLEQQIERLKASKQSRDDVNEKLEDAERRIAGLVKKHADEINNVQAVASKDVMDKQSVVDQLYKQLEDLEQQHSGTTTKLETNSDLINSLRIRAFGNLLLKNYYYKRQEQYTELEVTNKSLETALDAKNAEIERLNKLHLGVSDQLKESLNKHSDLKESHATTDATIADLENKNAALNAKLNDLQGNQNDLLQNKSDAQDRLFEVQAQMSAVQNKYKQLEELHVGLEKENLKLKSKTALLTKDIEELSAGKDIGQEALEQLREMTLKLANKEELLEQASKREERLNADIDGVFLEFTRVNGLLMDNAQEKQRLEQESEQSLKEIGTLKIKYDDMRLNMVSEGMDNQMLRSMIDGLKESYFEELDSKFKQNKEMAQKIKELESQNKEHLYNSSGKSTQTDA